MGGAYAPKNDEMCHAVSAGVSINAEYQSEEVNMVEKTTTKTPTEMTETVKQTKTRKTNVNLGLGILLIALIPKGYLTPLLSCQKTHS